MIEARWNNRLIAKSSSTIEVEGNHYFPPESVNLDHLRPCTHTSVCHWKGTAHYYDVVVSGDTNAAAAWYYPAPKAAADNLRGYIAFWKGVEVGP